MIAQQEVKAEQMDLWSRLAAPVPVETIAWRQDGRAVQRDGRYLARFVAYIEANTVRERLDSVVPGEWDLTLELMPQLPGTDEEGLVVAFKARLQILGVIREDVGTGRDYKQAATDAFKRAAVRFGIGHELYAYEQNWVALDGDGRYAKPLEDPAVAYARRYGGTAPATPLDTIESFTAPTLSVSSQPSARIEESPACPKCGGRMWDNRISKRNPKAPDYKCRDRSCDGVVWPAKAGKPAAARAAQSAAFAQGDEAERVPLRPTGTDDLPF